MNRPRVITLCGSTRFPEAWHLVNMHLTLRGCIVLSVGCMGHADQPTGAKFLTSDGDETRPEKQALDQLHFRKIDLSDGIFVVNPGDYIGQSTKREIEYALSLGKSVEYLFPSTRFVEEEGAVWLLSSVKGSEKVRATLAGTQVRIWCGQHGVWWAEKERGCTPLESRAGIFTFEDAYNLTSSCTSEQQIAFRIVSRAPDQGILATIDRGDAPAIEEDHPTLLREGKSGA